MSSWERAYSQTDQNTASVTTRLQPSSIKKLKHFEKEEKCNIFSKQNALAYSNSYLINMHAHDPDAAEETEGPQSRERLETE